MRGFKILEMKQKTITIKKFDYKFNLLFMFLTGAMLIIALNYVDPKFYISKLIKAIIGFLWSIGIVISLFSGRTRVVINEKKTR